MPCKLKILNGGSLRLKHWEQDVYCAGVRAQQQPHAEAARICGIKNRYMVRKRNSPRQGVLVRADKPGQRGAVSSRTQPGRERRPACSG